MGVVSVMKAGRLSIPCAEVRRAVLVASKRRARLVPPGVRRPDRYTPCEVGMYVLSGGLVSLEGVCVFATSCIVFVSCYTTEERSLRHSHMCLARWRSSLLKNGMVTLWAAICLRISLRRGERCWPPGDFNRSLVLRLSLLLLAASSDVGGASSSSVSHSVFSRRCIPAR